MMDEMMRNGSGYIDPTAYQGMTNVNPGEIWTQIGYEDDYWVILAVNGKIMTALKLAKRDGEGAIAVNCHEPMYTNPAMLCYIFANRLGAYVKTLPKKEFEAVQKAVADALGITGAVDKEDECLWLENDKLKEEQDILRQKLEEVNFDLKAEKMVTEALNEEADKLMAELAACKPYKDMYHELLDKLIAKVGVAL